MGITIDSKRLERALRRAPEDLKRTTTIAFRQHGAEFEKEYVKRHWGARLSNGRNTTSDRMASRTGALRRSVRAETFNKAGGGGGGSWPALRATIGNARTAAYTQTQEEGAVIRGNPWLAVPLPGNLTGSGRPRISSPQAALDDPTVQTFIQRSAGGALIIFRAFDDGRDPVPYWVLKRQVEVPARLNFRNYFLSKKMREDRVTRVNQAIRAALRARGLLGRRR